MYRSFIDKWHKTHSLTNVNVIIQAKCSTPTREKMVWWRSRAAHGQPWTCRFSWTVSTLCTTLLGICSRGTEKLLSHFKSFKSSVSCAALLRSLLLVHGHNTLSVQFFCAVMTHLIHFFIFERPSLAPANQCGSTWFFFCRRMVNLISSTRSGTMSPTHSVRSFTEQLSVSSTLYSSSGFFLFFFFE